MKIRHDIESLTGLPKVRVVARKKDEYGILFIDEETRRHHEIVITQDQYKQLLDHFLCA